MQATHCHRQRQPFHQRGLWH